MTDSFEIVEGALTTEDPDKILCEEDGELVEKEVVDVDDIEIEEGLFVEGLDEVEEALDEGDFEKLLELRNDENPMMRGVMEEFGLSKQDLDEDAGVPIDEANPADL